MIYFTITNAQHLYPKIPTRGGRGVKNGQNFADVFYGWPLIKNIQQAELSRKCQNNYNLELHRTIAANNYLIEFTQKIPRKINKEL